VQRLQRLTQIWSWLPHFRAVAETQHLPTAARAMHVSASALSRGVTQLERAIERPLFERVGRGLRITPAGEVLLAAARDAMRRLDDSLVALEPQRMVGALKLAAPSPWVRPLIMPAVARVVTPEGVAIELVDSAGADLAKGLLRGALDLVVDEHLVAHPELETTKLCELPRSVCCGDAHPLAKRRRVTRAELAAHGFAATEGDDGWPTEQPRRILVRSPRIEHLIEACLAGTCLAVLPRPVAVEHRLRPLLDVSTTAMYLQRRRPLAPAPVLDALAAAIGALGRRL